VLAALLARQAADLPDTLLRDASRQDAVRLLAWTTSAAALAAAALAEQDEAQAQRFRAQVRGTLAEAHALAWYPQSS
jgi:cell division septum initiation protein DivIVA